MENKTFPHSVTIKYRHVSSGGLDILSSVYYISIQGFNTVFKAKYVILLMETS